MVESYRKEACMKKIAIDARESGTSTGRYVDKLIENLYKIDPMLNITILTKPAKVEYMKTVAPKFKVVESNFKEFTFSEQIGFLSQLNQLKPDLVHFAMVQQPILYRGKTVTTMHDLTTARFRNPTKSWLVFTIKQQVYKWLNKRVVHKSDAIIAVSEFVKVDIAKFAKANSREIDVTYEAADKITDKAEPLPELEDKDFIMYVGRPQPHKNLDRLIEAFALLNKTHPRLKLVLAGKKDALYHQLEKKVSGQEIPDVMFTGFVSEGQLRWLYENTAAYVFPSLSEGFGLPGLEAMVHGAPVVSSNATCLPEVYGNAAHYFDPTDTSDMAEKISEVLSSKRLRKSLVEKGKKQSAKYSWRRMAEQTLALYQDILNK
jgi:glycosyltransferase involved in cell wall biosynthesis